MKLNLRLGCTTAQSKFTIDSPYPPESLKFLDRITRDRRVKRRCDSPTTTTEIEGQSKRLPQMLCHLWPAALTSLTEQTAQPSVCAIRDPCYVLPRSSRGQGRGHCACPLGRHFGSVNTAPIGRLRSLSSQWTQYSPVILFEMGIPSFVALIIAPAG